MGMLIEGRWRDDDLAGFKRDGKQVRFSSGFHAVVSNEADAPYPAATGRYALYCNRTCPWSHRAVATRALKGLDACIDLVLLEPAMSAQSWWFGERGEYRDPALGATYLHELYSASDPDFTGRVSIPVLWDKASGRIVNNDSGAIARMFNTQFDAFAARPDIDLYPSALRDDIDALNDYIGDRLNDGVYRCLLAATQADYETAFDRLFEALDTLDARLAHSRYLLGATPTEPDWRLFGVLARFDCVYYPLYKCNLKRIVDYDYLWDYTRDLYQLPGIADTLDIDVMKAGYYGTVKRGGLVPKGPLLDFGAPHGRG